MLREALGFGNSRQDFGFRGSGFRVQGLGFQGLEFRVEFRVMGPTIVIHTALRNFSFYHYQRKDHQQKHDNTYPPSSLVLT